jgi:hypothetical protein
MTIPSLLLAVLAATGPAAEPRAMADLAEPAALRALALAGAGEPGIREVQAAAAREADRGAPDPASFPRRARLSALLPRITAEYRHDERSNRVVGLQGSGEVDYLRLAPGQTFTLRATWDLGGLVAASGEVAASGAAVARVRRRAEAVAKVTSVYYERRRLAVALVLEPPVDAPARARAELELDRLGAELDALTGGRLSGERR